MQGKWTLRLKGGDKEMELDLGYVSGLQFALCKGDVPTNHSHCPGLAFISLPSPMGLRDHLSCQVPT
jgi:hypothetical protein